MHIFIYFCLVCRCTRTTMEISSWALLCYPFDQNCVVLYKLLFFVNKEINQSINSLYTSSANLMGVHSSQKSVLIPPHDIP